MATTAARPWTARVGPYLRYRLVRYDQMDSLHPVRLLRMASANWAARRYFERTPERRAILDTIARSASTGVGLIDYHLLHAYTVQRRPGRILELGSGASTLVIAQALAETAASRPGGAAGHLFSMEDIPSFHDDVKRLLPDHLAPFVTPVLSEKRESTWHGEIWGFHYAELPREPFAFVFVDGPTESKAGRKGACLDLLYLLQREPDRRVDVVVDRKFSSLEAFQSVLPQGAVTYDPVSDTGALAQVSGSMLLPRVRAGSRFGRADTWKVLSLSP